MIFGRADDDPGLEKFQKPAHDRRDVAGVADGHHHDQLGHVVFEILGDFIGVGFLAQNAPGVL